MLAAGCVVGSEPARIMAGVKEVLSWASCVGIVLVGALGAKGVPCPPIETCT